MRVFSSGLALKMEVSSVHRQQIYQGSGKEWNRMKSQQWHADFTTWLVWAHISSRLSNQSRRRAPHKMLIGLSLHREILQKTASHNSSSLQYHMPGWAITWTQVLQTSELEIPTRARDSSTATRDPYLQTPGGNLWPQNSTWKRKNYLTICCDKKTFKSNSWKRRWPGLM